MNNISCPNCNQNFNIDNEGMTKILDQVRTDLFEKELKARAEGIEQEKADTISKNQSKSEQEKKELLAEKDLVIERLQGTQRRAIDQLKSDYEMTIQKLQASLSKIQLTHELDRSQTVSELEAKAAELRSTMESLKKEHDLNIASQQLDMSNKLKVKDETIQLREEQIILLKDMKQRLSTKMLGESLEKHCEIEFNKLRTAAFPLAYFEKDNDARTGSKGDFIFRDFNSEGLETLSIMFEMKNQADETKTKKKNEDFLKELDKDREEKGCEYAVLVSLLETDNDLYNQGIVDVSHRFEKMYVIRPQFFIPLITILVSAAKKSEEYKVELERVRNQNLDITCFEEKVNDFKEKFSRNYSIASKQFEVAINEIDKSILHLQKTKENLHKSANNLRLANNKASELTIKRLVAGNPTMKKKFDGLKWSLQGLK